MSDRVLRGSRLGSVSYESELHTELAPRMPVAYDCPRGHATVVPLAAEADVPPTWECRDCGATALQRDAEQPEQRLGKPVRTHWDMLLERRSIAELEEVLAERLTALHLEQGKIKAQLKADAKARKKTA